MSSEIIKLFNERRNAYSRHSQRIVDALSDNVIAGVLDFIDLPDQDLDHLTWQEVTLVGTYIQLTGVVTYEIGEEITTPDGEKIVIDKNSFEDNSKFINVVVPVNLAEKGSKEEITKFLHELQAEQELDYLDTTRMDSEDTEERLPDDVSEFIEELLGKQLKQNSEFDLSKLTEDQQNALHLTYTSQDKKGKLH